LDSRVKLGDDDAHGSLSAFPNTVKQKGA